MQRRVSTSGSGSLKRRRPRAQPPFHANHRVDVHPEPAYATGHIRAPVIAVERVASGASLPHNDERAAVSRIKTSRARESPASILVRPPVRQRSIERGEQARGGLRREASAGPANAATRWPICRSCQRVEIPDAFVLHRSVRADLEAVGRAGPEARKPFEHESRWRSRVLASAGSSQDERNQPTAAQRLSGHRRLAAVTQSTRSFRRSSGSMSLVRS